MSEGLLRVLLLVPIFLFSLCVHEFAHAWMAVRRGDLTPLKAGRLTLQPLAHADLFGTLLLPIFCIYYGWPFFGWAKPVPVDGSQMKNGRKDMALVAAAGPASNILLGLLATALLAGLIRIPIENDVLQTVQMFTLISIQVNLFLAFFNLIPIPPLDGFMVLQGFLPSHLAMKLYKISEYSNVILLVLLISGGLRYLSIPVLYVFKSLITLAGVT